ncbi:hypothetical protein E1B28_001571 [Marasmius oreades]|uniref:BHLH domain-containing protein n=1 Tax=Marasmius oreades TaxID=181124 RepID=A0A9P7V3R6_9AGAR|nr:uncharacterized protein E1B28_001571 [Marasmius oreades]KAG7099758.1 hypothetical protein E1B28_001571 [Marasmius oreades]
MSLQPPVPYSDFEFTFNPQLPSLFSNPPRIPPSSELFTENETTDIFNFLEGFDTGIWDSEPIDPFFQNHCSSSSPLHLPPSTPYSNPHLNTAPEPSVSNKPRRSTRSASSRATIHSPTSETSSRGISQAPSTVSDSSTTSPPAASPDPAADLSTTSKRGTRTKPLLSTPQKRLNHIQSEQKRRNAIREGYAQLISLLSPAGSAPGMALGMPTRGRPKGSGSRGKGTNKGKSGVLFRAVEYCRWLEEGRDALRQEVLRLEEVAGIKHSS